LKDYIWTNYIDYIEGNKSDTDHLKELKESYGLSIRQIERLTGIGRGIIQRA
jgi:hypothetical protein